MMLPIPEEQKSPVGAYWSSQELERELMIPHCPGKIATDKVLNESQSPASRYSTLIPPAADALIVLHQDPPYDL